MMTVHNREPKNMKEQRRVLLELLQKGNPDASEKALSATAEAFLHIRDVTWMDIQLLLAIMAPDELKMIRNVGKTRQKALLNARACVNVDKDLINGILELKDYIYADVTEYERNMSIVAGLVCDLYYRGVRSLKEFEAIGPSILAWPYELPLDESCVAKRAYRRLLKEMHPDIQDPLVVIVYYNDTGDKNYYIGITKARMKMIAGQLAKKGYKIYTSGKQNDIPIVIIFAEEVKKDAERPANEKVD